MLEYKDPQLCVRVNLEPGVYPFEAESATGKTRLYKYLESLSASGLNVAAYNYTSYRTGARVTPSRPELLIVDRLDMFCTDAFLRSLSVYTDAVILLDIKHLPAKCPIRIRPRVKLLMRESEIEVGYASI